MKMRAVVMSVVMWMLAMFVLQGCRSMAPEKMGMEKKMVLTPSVHVCPDCHVMALEAGPCSQCEKDMKEMHVLGIKQGKALLCACAADCRCDAAGIADGKCACGKEVREMSAKGMYVCPLGCAELADKPGTCACGKKMTRVK